MKELEETNCEIRNIVNFALPLWDQVDKLIHQDELTIDGSKESNFSHTAGGFLSNDCKYAWLSHASRLVVVDVRYGKLISSWNFAYKVTSVSPFPIQSAQVPLLLVGLDNNAIRIKDSVGHLCIFDCCTSTILTTIEVPAGVEKACVIHSGADWEEYNDKRPDTVLPENTGLIFAALRNLQHIVIDINRPLWAISFHYGKESIAKLQFVNPILSHNTESKRNKREKTHLAYNLMHKDIEHYIGFDRDDFESTPLYDESLCSVVLTSTKIGCLITGCLGRVIIWQSDGSIGWISPPFDENAYVTHIALLEPSDDPRPFYYLWIACQNDSVNSSAVLRMYALFFNKKQNDKSGESSLYYDLQSEPSLKFELELEQGERVHSLLAVERENLRDNSDSSSRHGEDSMLLIGSDERVLLFDLNRWYKEQMPRTMAECRNPNSVMASYRTRQEELERKPVIACSYIPRSLREFPVIGSCSPEELFYPNSLTIEWIELGLDNLSFWLARGVQSELLKEITIAGPIVLVKPTETYRRCLTAGLVPFDSLVQDYSFDTDKIQQREMLLSLCLEQRWGYFLIRCATEWSDGSASYLYPEFLRWGVQRASEIKLITDRICIPLFDQSGNNIGESEVKMLRFCGQQLECLTTVVSKLPNIEEDLKKQKRALRRISTYLQVLLWFHDVGLLPESQDVDEDDNIPPISLSIKIPYPRDKLFELYQKKRESFEKTQKETGEELFIDQLINFYCFPLKAQWEKEAGKEIPNHGGNYPPPSLQSLLRSFLTDCYRDDQDANVDSDDYFTSSEMENKHSITIYLLMDLAMLLQGTHPSIDRLIKYPSAFKLSPSLIKLTQAFWLLDHEDYDGFFKIMTGQLISTSDIKDWHHKLAVNGLIKNNQHNLALTYLRVMKPPLSTIEDQGTIIGLSVGEGLVESAFHSRPPSHYSELLTRFFEACKANGKLANILHLSLDTEEEEAFIKFLKEEKLEDTRLLYYLQRCRHTEASDVFSLGMGSDLRFMKDKHKINPIALRILNAYNETLPDITKRFACSLSTNSNSLLTFNKSPLSSLGSSIVTNSGSFPRPMSQCRNLSKPICEVAINKARETCLKSERMVGGPTHIPFIGTPCSTIIFCTRPNGNMPEPSDANCVLFPEKKCNQGKRTFGMMHGGEDNNDGVIESKRPRFSNDKDLSAGDTSAARRFSMSQVCYTPLVQRKVPTDSRNPNSLATETPHSILKIRQMLRRNSDSPMFCFGNDSINENSAAAKRAAISDARPVRQIRFSMDRSSGNDDSCCTANDSNRENIQRESIEKRFEEDSCMEDSYYSPDISAKTTRDNSILSDNSLTKNIRGPRARPGLRKSSLLSEESSDYKSQKSNFSANTTIDATEMDVSFEKNKNISYNITHKSTQRSPSIYSASILSVNSSIENSPIKRPTALNNNERNYNDETEESESEESQVESEVVEDYHDMNINKDLSVKSPLTKALEETEDEEDKDEVQSAIQGEEDSEVSSVVPSDLPEENEISEDEVEEQDNEVVQECKKKMHEENCEQDDSFQSFSNSFENVISSEITDSCLRRLDEEIDRDTRYSLNQEIRDHRNITHSSMDYRFKHSIAMENPLHRSYNSNYSLTKPLFIDDRGTVKFNDSITNADITDDESMDAEDARLSIKSAVTHLIQEEDNEIEDVVDKDNIQGEEEEKKDELTLHFSASEESDSDKELQEQNKNEITSKKKNKVFENVSEDTISESAASFESINSFGAELLNSSLNKKGRRTPEISNFQLSPASCIRKQPTPRRSIKSMSVSPTACKTDVCKDNQGGSNTSPVKRTPSSHLKSLRSETSKQVDVLDAKLSPSQNIPTQSTQLSQIENNSTRATQLNLLSPSSKKSNKTKTKVSTITKESSMLQEAEKPARKTRTVSVSKESAPVECTVVEKKANRTRGTKVSSKLKDTVVAPKEDLLDQNDAVLKEVLEKTVSPKTRSKKSANVIKTVNVKSNAIGRRTRATSVTTEDDVQEDLSTARKPKVRSALAKEDAIKVLINTRTDTKDDETKVVANKTRGAVTKAEQTTMVPRKTRAGSIAKEEEVITTVRKTRAGSVAKEEETTTLGRKTRAGSLADEVSVTGSRKTRAGSVLKEDEMAVPMRKTRAGSVAKEEGTTVMRKTRGSSQVKETVTNDEEVKLSTGRSSRASSVTKESCVDDQNEASNRRVTRKRGNSVPKEIPAAYEITRLQMRSRRSTSLLKEVILEESMSQLDSPVRISKIPRTIEDTAASSPAANTRSRRSSLQSIPDDVEEVLAYSANIRSKTRKSLESTDEGRNRRAMSVDSVLPVSKRLTRSVLAKTTILEEAIPEEAGGDAFKSKKQPTRRKRATSLTVDTIEEVSKDKPKTGRPKRGRKASESKDYQFSPPQKAGDVFDHEEDDCQAPTFKFSQPTKLEKFISPESSDVRTKALESVTERKRSVRTYRTRTCFVLPKRRKDGAK